MTNTTPNSADALKQCRDEFEAWHRSKFATKSCAGQPTRDMHNGIYAEKYGPENQQKMWEAWQAAWNRRPTPAPAETVESCIPPFAEPAGQLDASAGETLDEKAENALLWCYRRLQHSYGRLPFVEEAVTGLRERAIVALLDRREREAAAGAVPEGLNQIGELLRTQDNRYTDQPLFIVQQKRRLTGFDTDYCDNIVWLASEDDYSEASAEEAARLEAEYQDSGKTPQGWMRTGYMDQWEFVTACLTEQGCKDYLKRDGHNLKEPRIYADGSYRNEEYRTVRNWLLSLAAAPKAAPSEQKPIGYVPTEQLRRLMESDDDRGLEGLIFYKTPRALSVPIYAAPSEQE